MCVMKHFCMALSMGSSDTCSLFSEHLWSILRPSSLAIIEVKRDDEPMLGDLDHEEYF